MLEWARGWWEFQVQETEVQEVEVLLNIHGSFSAHNKGEWA